MPTTRVLVVEDEQLVRRKLALGLTAQGFEVFEASDAYACRAVMKREPLDVVLLDLGLPGLAGLPFAQELRERPDLALIVVSRESEPGVLIRALDAGCDDFVVKPVHEGELAARIRSVLRRRSPAPKRNVRLGSWRIDFEAQSAEGPEGSASLTRGEFAVLRRLIVAEGRIVGRGELMQAVSARPAEADERTVDALVSRLRRKLPLPGGAAELVVTAPGQGYRLGVKALGED